LAAPLGAKHFIHDSLCFRHVDPLMAPAIAHFQYRSRPRADVLGITYLRIMNRENHRRVDRCRPCVCGQWLLVPPAVAVLDDFITYDIDLNETRHTSAFRYPHLDRRRCARSWQAAGIYQPLIGAIDRIFNRLGFAANILILDHGNYRMQPAPVILGDPK